MKTLRPIILLLLGLIFTAKAQTPADDFVTVWDLSVAGSSATGLSFGVGTVGSVNYTWETIPAGSSGSGTFSGSTATITGLPTGANIRLRIQPANFRRININNGSDRNRLLDVEQWGTVNWNSMQSAFWGCSNLNITSSDIPNLSGVTNMGSMFRGCAKLNGPTNIGNWNTGNVTNMGQMFLNATSFNQPIGNWNTGNVTNMGSMFSGASVFNQPIGNWNTGNVTNMGTMFSGASVFNEPISNWNTENVTNMTNMFAGAITFNQPIGNWNTGNVTNMGSMFSGARTFNQPIGNWNTGNVTNMGQMFANATAFNQPIGNWNTGNVTSMISMFDGATAFNQPIVNWNTGNVTNMSFMFNQATNFNQPIVNWNTEKVTNMSGIFSNATSFNQPIGNWNTGNVTDMQFMFNGATYFNQPIGNWNTEKVTNMFGMFANAASFNQPIGNWNTGNVTTMQSMFIRATTFNQPIGNWNTGNVTFMNSMFDGATSFNQPIGNWNTEKVTIIAGMFGGAIAFNQPIGNWNMGNVTNMNSMFNGATSFDQPIGNWNTGNVTDMTRMFQNATSYNQPIGNWNTGNVTNMQEMFRNATSFNHPIGDWNIGKVTNMSIMFFGATSFNQSLGNWTLNPAVNLASMFNTGMNCINYSATLIGWANNPNTPNGRSLGANGRSYGTNAAAARQALIAKGWTIAGDVASAGECVACVPPAISQQPQNVNAVVGNPANFTVGFSGTSPSFEWKRGNTVLSQFTGSTANIPQVLMADQGKYTVKLTNSCGSITSDTALLTVSPKPITLTGLVVNAKEYDGNETAAFTGGSLNGLLTIHSSSVGFSGTVSFNNKNVGNNKPITTNFSLTGADAINYTLGQPTGLTSNISPKTINIMGLGVQPKTYDGTDEADVSGAMQGVVSGDNVNAEFFGTYDNKNVGTNKPVTVNVVLRGIDAPNYVLVYNQNRTGSIFPASIEIAGTFTVKEKIFDGNTDAEILENKLEVSGWYGSDVVNIASVKAMFEDASIGENKKVYLSEVLLGGVDAPNYIVDTETLPTTIGVIKTNEPTSLNDALFGISLYPNPAKYSVQVNGIKEAEMELINMQGQTLKKGKASDSFEVSELNKGMYYVKIIQGNKANMLKLMVE